MSFSPHSHNSAAALSVRAARSAFQRSKRVLAGPGSIVRHDRTRLLRWKALRARLRTARCAPTDSLEPENDAPLRRLYPAIDSEVNIFNTLEWARL